MQTVLEDGDNDDDKMADTSQQQQEAPEPPQTNGAVDGLTEEEKSKIRPADIDAVSAIYVVCVLFVIHLLIHKRLGFAELCDCLTSDVKFE